MDEWATNVAGHLAASTAKRYAVSLSQCRPILEPLRIDEITRKTLDKLIVARRDRGATNATIRRDLTAISQILAYAEDQGWREGNPAMSKRRTLKERRDPIVLPEPTDIETVIAAASTRFGALIRAAWLTGCRQNELVTMPWKALDAERRTLTFTGKGNKRRTIDLSDAALAHFLAQPRTSGSPLIFCREDGKPYAEAASDFTHVRRTAEARAKKEGRAFRRFRFHDLRHLYAVEALRRGEGVYALSKHLGHSSVTVTEIYLAFLSPSEAEQAKKGKQQTAG